MADNFLFAVIISAGVATCILLGAVSLFPQRFRTTPLPVTKTALVLQVWEQKGLIHLELWTHGQETVRVTQRDFLKPQHAFIARTGDIVTQTEWGLYLLPPHLRTMLRPTKHPTP